MGKGQVTLEFSKRTTRSSCATLANNSNEVKMELSACAETLSKEEKTPRSTRRATRSSSTGPLESNHELQMSNVASTDALFDTMGQGETSQFLEKTARYSSDTPLVKGHRLKMNGSSPSQTSSEGTGRKTRACDLPHGSSQKLNTSALVPSQALSGELGKDSETQELTRRRTRSSSETPAKGNCELDMIGATSTPSTSCDQLFARQHINLEKVLSEFPGRRRQILDILQLIGPKSSPMIPLFVYGGVSTGKTSVVLQIFSYLNRPFVYSSCCSCYSSRCLFETVLNQLLLHSRNASNCYASAKRCDRFSDFVNFLRDALTTTLQSMKERSKDSGTKDHEKERMIYLIFDNVEQIRDWEKGATLMSLLFNLNDLLKMREVGLIFISSSTLDTFYSNTGFLEPVPIFFPGYTEDEFYQIFMKNQPNPKLYSSFLDAVLRPFSRITRQVDELSTALQPLFHKYCEPLDDLKFIPDENTRRRLFTLLQPYLARSLKEVFMVASPSSAEFRDKGKHRENNKRKFGGDTSDELDFHMSLCAKCLLISAFLASQNPATLDAALFDSTNKSDNQKRKRKSSEASTLKKDLAVQEQLLKGPGTFPLERLLAIFQCITPIIDDFSQIEQEDEHSATESQTQGLMSDVLLQFSTLCDVNFVSRGGTCPLEGSTRYRCMVDEDMALKVARSVKFPLSKFLYRR